MINKIPSRFGWLIHNMVAHPLMGVCHPFGLEKLGWAVHDALCPED